MNDVTWVDVPSTPWLWVLLVGAALVLAHLGARDLARRLPRSARVRRVLLRWLPLSVAVTAVVYGLWAAHALFSWDPVLARVAVTAVMAVAAVAGFFAVADLVAGVVLRVSGLCTVGDRIRVGDIAGEVVAVGLRTLHLETDAGERIVVPHRRLVTVPMIRAPKDEVSAHVVRVALPEHVDPTHTRRALARVVSEHHAVSVARAPTVAVGDDGAVVTFYLVVPDAVADVERQIRDAAAGLADGGTAPVGSTD